MVLILVDLVRDALRVRRGRAPHPRCIWKKHPENPDEKTEQTLDAQRELKTWSGAEMCKWSRSWKMLETEYSVAEAGLGPAEKEPPKGSKKNYHIRSRRAPLVLDSWLDSVSQRWKSSLGGGLLLFYTAWTPEAHHGKWLRRALNIEFLVFHF